MKYCSKCGKGMDDTATSCPNCGAVQEQAATTVTDNGGFLWGLLGCCIPIVGLVLFLVWKDTKPKTAKAAGLGALICVILYIVLYILAAILGVSLAAGMY